MTDTAPKAAPARPSAPPAAPDAAPEKVSSGYSLPPALHDDLRAKAKERGVTASYLVELSLVRPLSKDLA